MPSAGTRVPYDSGGKRLHFHSVSREVIERAIATAIVLNSVSLWMARPTTKARANEVQEARPGCDSSIIRGTLLWTHCSLTYLPSSTRCLAASSIPYWRQIKGNPDWSAPPLYFCNQSSQSS
jgi:hypothetical protein